MKCVCRECGATTEIESFPRIDAQANPELKERLRNGDLFLWSCPGCGTRNVESYSLVYTDSAEGVLVCLSPTYLNAEEDVPGFRIARQVESAGALIEKIAIFDAGLDDIAVEICKLVTQREMGKEVNLRFLRQDGPDGSLVMAYPENGEMQMLEIGLNVYQDCLAILSRNPGISASVKGLARIDASWVARFFR